jgi:hypothetical protein
MLDAYLKFGSLAERTDKQPGIPGTQQCTWNLFQEVEYNAPKRIGPTFQDKTLIVRVR